LKSRDKQPTIERRKTMRATYTIVSIAIMAYLAFGGAREIFKPAAPKTSLVHYETKKVSATKSDKPVKRYQF